MATPPPGGPALLAARFPALAAGLPRIVIGHFPTPLAPAAALGEALGVPQLLVKDDGGAAAGYGGNKVRKLEYLLAAARARGCDTVVTFGAAGSNHALATAIHARALGLACHAILTGQPASPRVADTLRWHARLGTVLHAAGGYADSRAIAAGIRASHPRGPDAVYDIPWGGSSPLGTLGFVAAGLELAAQLAADGRPAPQALYVPLGTMGTATGLAIGLALAGLPTRIVGVQVVPDVVASEGALRTLATATLALLRSLAPDVPPLPDPLAALTVRTDCFGDGYAVATPAARRVVATAAAHGLALETTYSGKALAALAADARELAADGRPVLFWATVNTQPPPADLGGVTAAALPVELRHYLD